MRRDIVFVHALNILLIVDVIKGGVTKRSAGLSTHIVRERDLSFLRNCLVFSIGAGTLYVRSHDAAGERSLLALAFLVGSALHRILLANREGPFISWIICYFV